MSSQTINSKAPPHPPRLSHMLRTPDFVGYGFNLHTIRQKTGQFIGNVDEESPAERALLKEGDKIIEVNGVNIASENHKQVVSRIKLVPNETKLLVVDEAGELWYRDHNIVITGDLKEVVYGTSHVRPASTSSAEDKQEDKTSLTSESSAAISDHSSRQDSNTAVDGVVPLKTEDSDIESIKDEKSELANGTEREFVSPTENESNKSNASISSDEDESIAKELITNGKLDEAEDVSEKVEEATESIGKVDQSDDSEFHDEKIEKENLKNTEPPSLKEMVQDNIATKREPDDDSNSCKSRSNGSRRSIASVSSASSRGSGGHSQGTDRVADKSPMSTSPSPPSSVGAPSPTPSSPAPPPVYNKNIEGLNMNMSAVEMRAYLASKKKKDIRTNTDIDLRKKYEIVQKL